VKQDLTAINEPPYTGHDDSDDPNMTPEQQQEYDAMCAEQFQKLQIDVEYVEAVCAVALDQFVACMPEELPAEEGPLNVQVGASDTAPDA
jgi:hypothetical protein